MSKWSNISVEWFPRLGQLPSEAGQKTSAYSSKDLLRLFHFEGPGYLPSRQLAIDSTGRRLEVWVLLPDSRRLASGRGWRLRGWQLLRKARILSRLRVWMREFERLEGDSVDITWLVRRQLRAWREAGDLPD